MNPQPVSAQTVQAWGVVSEVVPDGTAVERARQMANMFLDKPEVTRRNPRVLFTQPLKEALVRSTALGFSLEGASVAALFKPARQ